MRSEWRHHRLVVLIILLIAWLDAGAAFGMEVFVILPNGQHLKVPTEPEQTVSDIKNFVFNVTEIHTINQLMYKGDSLLDDEKTVASCNIADNDTLVVKYGSKDTSIPPSHAGLYTAVIVFLVVVGFAIYKLKKILSE